MNPSRIETLEIESKSFRIRHWGPAGAPVVFMLHGWMDCSATFQFVIDALRQPWHVIAPDWRGHGGSHRTGESYPFLQYIADLDGLLEHYSPGEPVRIVAHSLGANALMVYAGARPERIRRMVNLEGLAPLPRPPGDTPAERLSKWLATLRKGVTKRYYRTHEELASRLRRANPRLTAAQASFLAGEFSRARMDGALEFDTDPYQHVGAPVFGHESLVDSTWARISAPVLLVTAAESEIVRCFDADPEVLARRIALLKQVEHVHLDGAGHNLHHDRPEPVAALIERFLAGP